ncbi:MAG: NUDIX hydrolase [Candidatus Sumerlaeia bacterium]|nr:NUDIX hydrolase [Candidatus Sumerlaeia bacterium]
MSGDSADYITVVHEGKFLRYLKRGAWEYVERNRRVPGVIVAALTPGGCLLLVEQYRPPVNARVIELPAGLVGDEGNVVGESVLVAAQRELEEETGWHAGEMEEVARGPISAGLTNEEIIVVRARYLERVGAGGGVAGEDIMVHEVSLRDLKNFLVRRQEAGCLIDPKVMLAPWYLQDWTPGTQRNTDD